MLGNEIDNLFTYHPPKGNQAERYQIIRDKAKELALVIVACTPASADQTAAIRKLRECTMTANAAIACNEEYADESPTAEEIAAAPSAESVASLY
jgi:hypothetical protein